MHQQIGVITISIVNQNLLSSLIIFQCQTFHLLQFKVIRCRNVPICMICHIPKRYKCRLRNWDIWLIRIIFHAGYNWDQILTRHDGRNSPTEKRQKEEICYAVKNLVYVILTHTSCPFKLAYLDMHI